MQEKRVRERDRDALTVGQLRDALTDPTLTHVERAQRRAALLLPVRGTQIERRIMRTLQRPLRIDATRRFESDLAQLGWDVQRLDVDITGAHPALMMTLTRLGYCGDVLCVTLHAASTGRATITREHHEAAVQRTGERYAKIHLVGRTTHEGAWPAVKALAAYVCDNVRADVRQLRRADRLVPFREFVGALRSEVG